jgi:hypothetical protein
MILKQLASYMCHIPHHIMSIFFPHIYRKYKLIVSCGVFL